MVLSPCCDFSWAGLVGDIGGEHPLRRWTRQCTRYAPSLALPVGSSWNYQVLEPLVKSGNLSQQQMKSILEASAKELLFELAFQEYSAIESQGASNTTVRIVSEKLTDFEKAPSIRFSLDELWPPILAEVQLMVSSSNLIEFNPVLCPSIVDRDQVARSVSASGPRTTEPNYEWPKNSLGCCSEITEASTGCGKNDCPVCTN